MSDKYDSGKPMWYLLPFKQVEEVVKVFTHGANKYSPFGWKDVEGARQRYFSACMRHISAWYYLEDKDKETKLSHLAHAICCLLILMWHTDKT